MIKISTRYEHGSLPIKVLIEDNGVGIPDELKDNIFDAFVTNMFFNCFGARRAQNV